MSRILLGASLVLAAASASSGAHAGAWLAPEGGQTILVAAAGERDGQTVAEASAYWETPLGARSSIVAAPWVERADDVEDGWRAEAVIGVKRAVFRTDASVMAVQASAIWRSDPPRACGEGGVEARWLGGHALGAAFLNLEAAARVLDGGCSGGRADLTAGFRLGERGLALGQIFLDAPDEGDESIKAQLSLVRFGLSGRGFQVGVRARLDGAEPEPALVVSLWSRG